MYSKSTPGTNDKFENAVVIGAGIGGLTAACLLARQGTRVTLFERNDISGGKMGQIEHSGFRFDTGPSLFTMPEVLEHLFTYCGEKLQDYITYEPLHPVCRYFFQDGHQFDSFHDRAQAVAEITKFSPEDAVKYGDFLDYASAIYARTAGVFLFHPLQKWRDLLQMPLSDALRIDAFSTVSDRVDSYFSSGYLRQFFKRFTTYNGSSPYQAPATLNVISHVELVKGGYYVNGGMYQIAGALTKLAVSLGVDIRYGSSVDQILTDNGNAVGVSVGGRVFQSDLVISNADANESYLKLLPKADLSVRRRTSIDKLEPSCSGFVILLGCRKKWDQLAHHSIFFSADYEGEFEDIFRQKRLPKNPTIYVANTSVTDASHAPEGGSNLFVMVNAPYLSGDHNPSDTAGDYTSFVIDELERRGLDGLRQSIAVQEVLHAGDFYERYRSNRGSIYGTSSNTMFSAFLRPRNRSPYVGNLWLVGGSTHPGGGIPLCVLSAFHACGVSVPTS